MVEVEEEAPTVGQKSLLMMEIGQNQRHVTND